ncbi:enoyl-ACP reductase [Roseibium sp. SCPC15]|uniref:enoyl-ACP reductase FabI n=1 Tax=Roseibium sp. SCP15 TaxID=3141376 RepID=UPI00333DBCFD
MNNLFEGKTGLVLGVANKHSLCWGIASALSGSGAGLLLSYAHDTVGKRVRGLAEELQATCLECDVSSDDSLDRFFVQVSETLNGRPLDFVVHGVSFSDKRELDGPYLDTSRSNFQVALDVSAYSLTALCQRAVPLMTNGGSILTLTYLGAEKVVPNYNVMGVAKAALEASVRYLAHDLGPSGITVNAISAGPIKTLAASGISGLRSLIKWNAMNAPLRRNTTIEEVGDAALFCLSHLGRGMTGEVLHIDSGFHTTGIVARANRAVIDQTMA